MGFKGRLTYHFVFSTKYRKQSLAGIEEELYTSITKLAAKSHFKVLEMAVENGDHIHLVVKANQSVSPAQIARSIKQRTTFDLWESSSVHLRRFYWGKKKRLWSGGYFCGTVGNVSLENVLQHVKAQADSSPKLKI